VATASAKAPNSPGFGFHSALDRPVAHIGAGVVMEIMIRSPLRAAASTMRSSRPQL
jgi:hypothetical protein